MGKFWPGPNERAWAPDEPMPSDWVAGEDEWRVRVAAWRRIQADRAARDRADADRVRRLTGGRLEGRSGVHHDGVGFIGHHVTPKELKAEAKRRRKAAREARAEEIEREIHAEKYAADRMAEIEAKIEADERREAEVEFARRVGFPAPPPVVEPALRASSVTVGDERLVYGEGSDFSWYRDLAVATSYGFGRVPVGGTRSADLPAAVWDRLVRGENQTRRQARSTPEAHAVYRAMFAEATRAWMETISTRGAQHFAEWAATELRAGTTAATSLGSFTPPFFALQAFEIYRTAAATAAAQCDQRELPKTGMKVTIPALTSKVDVAEQATEATTTASSTPTATFRSAPVVTLAAHVDLSQQLVDRAGPGVTADMVLTEAAARQCGTALDEKVLSAILAATGLQSITSTGTAPSAPGFWTDVAHATSKLQTTDGVRLAADSVILPPQLGAWYMAQKDKQTRPIFEPAPSGVGGLAGAPTSLLEGFTGFSVAGARVLGDASSQLQSTTDALVIVGAFRRGAAVYKAQPVVRVVVGQPGAKTLTLQLTFTQYVAVSILFPAAFCKVSSTTGAYPWTPTF